ARFACAAVGLLVLLGSPLSCQGNKAITINGHPYMGHLCTLLLKLVVICACCSIGACASTSIAFNSLRLVEASDSSGRSVAQLSPVMPISRLAVLPNRELMRVEFTASADLWKMAMH